MVVAMDITQEHQLRKALEEYSHQLEVLAAERTRDLFQSQERFRHLFENNRDALFAADNQGAITEVNNAWLKLLGYSSRWDVLGKHFLYDIISHRNSADQIMKTLVARQMVEDELITIRRPDGKEISALLTVSSHPHPTTSLPTYEGVLRDVTQLKALEEKLVEHSIELERLVSERSRQLAESESKLRRLMDNSPDILYRLNFPLQRFEFISPAVYSITGYRPEELISLSWEGFLGLIHPDDQGEYLRLFSRLTRKGRSRGSERFTIGFRMKRKDGDWIWLEDHGVALRNWDGSLEAIEGVIRDVTIQRKAELQLTRQAEILEAEVQRRTAELVESESRYRLLLSEAGDIIFTCDAQGQILEMNRRGEEMFGKSVEEINRIGLFSLLEELSRRKFRRALRICFQKGLKTDPFPIEYPTPSGGRLYLEIQSTPILIKGKVSMALNVCRDLTARKKAAEALRALKIWSENIVHSINEGIFIENKEGICEYVNPAMERMLGFSAKEMIGKHWSAFVPPEKIEELVRQTAIREHQGWNRYEATLLSAE
ncbi:MAG: PAS domain S-box protein, partial [bacterium]